MKPNFGPILCLSAFIQLCTTATNVEYLLVTLFALILFIFSDFQGPILFFKWTEFNKCQRKTCFCFVLRFFNCIILSLTCILFSTRKNVQRRIVLILFFESRVTIPQAILCNLPGKPYLSLPDQSFFKSIALYHHFLPLCLIHLYLCKPRSDGSSDSDSSLQALGIEENIALVKVVRLGIVRLG